MVLGLSTRHIFRSSNRRDLQIADAFIFVTMRLAI